MPLSDEETFKIEIDEAWEMFCDDDERNHARLLKVVDPNCYQMMRLAYGCGYVDGGQSTLRSLKP